MCAATVCLVGFFISGSIDVVQHGLPAWDQEGRMRDRQVIDNPYGSYGLGAAWYISGLERLELTTSLQHQSSMPLRDRGENQLRIEARYWLWRR